MGDDLRNLEKFRSRITYRIKRDYKKVLEEDDILTPYPMRGPKKGAVLVINNIEFEKINFGNVWYDKLERRDGADVDAENLKKLFIHLGFIWIYWENYTRKEIRKKLKEFTDDTNKILSEVDSFFLIVMSHGSDDKFFAHDNFKIEYTEIIDQFSNSCCKQLQGKPKVIVFQTCRGDLEDLAIEFRAESRNVVYDQPEINFTGPIKSDMLVCYSTSPGFRSFRDSKGSWFIQCFYKVFIKHSYNRDVETLFKIVAAEVIKKRTEDDALQIPRIENILFRKFYLYPLSKQSHRGFYTWCEQNIVIIFIGAIMLIFYFIYSK